MTSTNKKPKTYWRKTIRYDENGCLICDNRKNHDGYVRVNVSEGGIQRMVMLHVYLWGLSNGTKPEGREINHKCGNRGCCNLEHLELICGSAHASLTNVSRVGYTKDGKSNEVISKIYERVKYGGEFINQMCLEYNIKRSTLSNIINKRSRCNITDLVDIKYLNNPIIPN